jgi:retinol dehydrogenase 12
MALLTGKTVVVTGATAGIGFQAVRDFAATGAQVIGVGRSVAKCEEIKSRIQMDHPTAHLEYLCANLSSQRQIHVLADQVKNTLVGWGADRLDVLVNNAGLYMGKKVLTEDRIETTFAVNHVAVFMLTHLLLPVLSRSETSRVITVSSGSHYKTKINPERAKNPRVYFGLWAYQVSKLANVLFTAEFNRRQDEMAPHAYAMDPGLVNTDIGLKQTGWLARLVWKNRQKLGVSVEVPSKTILYLAGEPALQNAAEVYWYKCAPREPNPLALDHELGKRLWDESLRICGMLPELNTAHGN